MLFSKVKKTTTSIAKHLLLVEINTSLHFLCQVFRKLTTLFKSLGVKAIFDTSCSRDLTLIESCNEFMVRYKQSQSTGNGESKPPLPMISSACPGNGFIYFGVCLNFLLEILRYVLILLVLKLQVGYATLRRPLGLTFFHTFLQSRAPNKLSEQSLRIIYVKS